MISTTLLFFFCLPAVTTFLPLQADVLNQDRVKPPPSLKVPKRGDFPPSNIRKRFDRPKNTTYVDIDVPLVQQNQSLSMVGEDGLTAGETSLSFRLEFKGSSASELTAAYLTINFDDAPSHDEQFKSGSEVEVQADAYQFSYQSIGHKTEQVISTENVGRPTPLKKESISIKLPLEDLQQVAYANRVDIKLGKKKLRVRSIQLGDLRKTLIAQNAN
jgi:hypothetical protein